MGLNLGLNAAENTYAMVCIEELDWGEDGAAVITFITIKWH